MLIPAIGVGACGAYAFATARVAESLRPPPGPSS
jgi:hypothetical protein